MKKILAAALAVIMAATVMASCGDKKDDSSSKADTASSAAAESTEESKADAESKGGDESNDEPKAISEMPGELTNQETASFKFSTDMNVEDFVSDMASHDYKDDESHTSMTIEELEGIPMLRIQTLDQNQNNEYKVPKIHFDMSKLFKGHEEDLPKIFKIKADVVTKAVGTIKDDNGEDRMVPAFFGGKFVTQPYSEADKTQSWNELLEFSWSEWTSEWAHYELEITPGIMENAKFINTTEPQYLALMKWSIVNQADLYIANLTFLDQDGNVIACHYGE